MSGRGSRLDVHSLITLLRPLVSRRASERVRLYHSLMVTRQRACTTLAHFTRRANTLSVLRFTTILVSPQSSNRKSDHPKEVAMIQATIRLLRGIVTAGFLASVARSDDQGKVEPASRRATSQQPRVRPFVGPVPGTAQYRVVFEGCPDSPLCANSWPGSAGPGRGYAIPSPGTKRHLFQDPHQFQAESPYQRLSHTTDFRYDSPIATPNGKTGVEPTTSNQSINNAPITTAAGAERPSSFQPGCEHRLVSLPQESLEIDKTNRKTSELMKQYHELYKAHKYQQAEVTALKAQELDPDNYIVGAAVQSRP